jgi:hypothetical protein
MIELTTVHTHSITPAMLDGPRWLSYVMTPFMAISLAYQLGAKKIGLLGVDLRWPSPLRFHVGAISAKLVELQTALATKGVALVNLSPNSAIRVLPRAVL